MNKYFFLSWWIYLSNHSRKRKHNQQQSAVSRLPQDLILNTRQKAKYSDRNSHEYGSAHTACTDIFDLTPGSKYICNILLESDPFIRVQLESSLNTLECSGRTSRFAYALLEYSRIRLEYFTCPYLNTLEYSRSTSLACALNTLGFYGVTIAYSRLEYSSTFSLWRGVTDNRESCWEIIKCRMEPLYIIASGWNC